MNILLTGATGFLGSHLLPALKEAGHEVIAPSREIWDLSTQSLPREKLPEKIDVVVHLAQSPRYREFPAGMPDMMRVNVSATADLLDYAASAGAKSFVFTSTGSVYEASTEAIDEDAPVVVDNGYAASKLAAEMICEPYSELFRLCVLRPFNIYGPGQTKMLMPALAQRVREGHAIDLIGSEGGLTLTPTYVGDAVRVIQKAIEKGWNETINLAGPQIVTLREVGETLGKILGVEAVFHQAEGVSTSRFADTSRLRELVGSTDFVGLQEGLEAAFKS